MSSEAGKPGMPVPQLHASVKKVVSLLDGPRTVLSSKAWVNVDPQAQKVSARHIRLGRTGYTDIRHIRFDIRVT